MTLFGIIVGLIILLVAIDALALMLMARKLQALSAGRADRRGQKRRLETLGKPTLM